MKLQKETEERQAVRNRWYNDACGTAFALDLIGERWSILIMRELMFGPRRFGELRAGLPGISAKILTQRLEGLEASRIVQKGHLPPPSSAQVYELSEWGYEAETIIQELGRWATRHPAHDPALPLSAASIMMSFRTMLNPKLAEGFAGKIGFKLGDDRFIVKIGNGELDTQRAEAEDVDAVFEAEPTIIAAAVYGGEPLANLEAAGLLTIVGSRELAEKFVKLFTLPEKFGEVDR